MQFSLARRLWTYQAERFPVFKHGVVIAVFALAGARLPSLLSGAAPALDPAAALVAILVSFLFFLQLRIADEHKDKEDDRRFRPERPVPRGLVSLNELRWLGVAAALGQIALAWALDARLLLPLAIVWLWMGLMTAEFFAPHALKARPALYLASHMVVSPLIASFAVACGWIVIGTEFEASPPVLAFLALAYANGAAVEIARKTRAPADERRGVETYSKLWGPRGAALAAASAVIIGCGLAYFILQAAGAPPWSILTTTALAALGLAAAVAYAVQPTSRLAGLLDGGAGAWVLGSYLLLALAPVISGAPA